MRATSGNVIERHVEILQNESYRYAPEDNAIVGILSETGLNEPIVVILR